MEQFKIEKENSNTKVKQLQDKINKRLQVQGSSLLGNNDNSDLFELDNSISEDFTIFRVHTERATLREASCFKKFMEQVYAEHNKHMIVDLSECEFIDSSFFGVLVSGVKRMKSVNKKFYLVYDYTNRLPIFSATGLDKVFTVFESMEEAISS